MGHVLRFRFDKTTNEVEYFTVDTDGEFAPSQVEDSEHNRAHNEFTHNVVQRMARNATVEELVDFFSHAPVIPDPSNLDPPITDPPLRERGTNRT